MMHNDTAERIHCVVEHAAHLLPAQGPIEVFVHHNTLHAFEQLPFRQAVLEGLRAHGANPYLPEEEYRREMSHGRIRPADLKAVLLDDPGNDADQLIGSFGTRYALRLAMLQFPLRSGNMAELNWVMAETDALERFREEVTPSVRKRMIDETRGWLTRESAAGRDPKALHINGLLDGPRRQPVGSRTWEASTLQFLWKVCCDNVLSDDSDVPLSGRSEQASSTGAAKPGLWPGQQEVNRLLIQFCSTFLDQGFASWHDEARGADRGFLESFLQLYSLPLSSPTAWLKAVSREAQRVCNARLTAVQSIAESMSLLGVNRDDEQSVIAGTLLELPGWAGMIHQLETNAEWTVRPAPAGSLIDYVAVRLLLKRVAAEVFGAKDGRDSVAAAGCNGSFESARERHLQRAFTLFQLAQFRGWNPHDLQQLSVPQWRMLQNEVNRFSSLERRRIYHLAFERKYCQETLDAVLRHTATLSGTAASDHSAGASASRSVCPDYQVVCCIDEREESFRRHLEETDPGSETLGIAGFFGVAMYYRGISDAHFTPLCPVNVKPQHYVTEEPVYSQTKISQRRAQARRRLGEASHRAHMSSRSFVGGLLTGLLGSLAAFPLVARTLFPRTTARIRQLLQRMVEPPATELRIERLDQPAGDGNGQCGYTIAEMADIVDGGLRALGLADPQRLSRLVIFCGHGSSSLNNPHEAAHDCGACGGGRGGPNARAFAQMANDPRVRRLLGDRGLTVPDDTVFLGSYHNTCDDSIIWYDLDRLQVSQRSLFERAKNSIDEARTRSSHERCRRFESADLSLTCQEALCHVEGRAEDLSQTRPEYGHATNALCFVGRRQWSRGLFLDRRAFLTSYDPTQDDETGSVLENMLRAVIPVCAGINLEYYFSYVDPIRYGCGTKLPHNITSLIGVMDGAASDLRPGLPWQMVEIHEPVRLLFVVESTIDVMKRIIADNELIAQLVCGEWVQLAVFDADRLSIQLYRNGDFAPYEPRSQQLPVVESSLAWYGGRREHLGFASIHPHGNLL